MPPVVGFIAGGFGLTAASAMTGYTLGAAFTAGVLGNLVFRMGVSLALSAISRALAPKPKVPAIGMRSETTLKGGVNPEAFGLGRYATTGAKVCPDLSHGNAGKTPNAFLQTVIELAGIPGHQLSRVWIAGEEAPILEDSPHADYGKRLGGRFEGRAWVKYYDGTQTDADPMLLAKYPAPSARPWTSDMVAHGICYAIVTFQYDREVFSSWPTDQLRFEMLGLPLYDPRRDSTAGGTGSQRWADPSTWQISHNPAVQAYNVLRGIALPGGQNWGGTVEAADLPYAVWAAAMDACDESVDDGDGGTEAAWRAGIEVLVDDEPYSIIAELTQSCCGALSETGGTWGIRVGSPGLPVLTIADDDLVRSEPDAYRPFPSIDKVYNGVEATYPEPEAAWASTDAPAIYNSTWEAEDDGRRLVAALNFPACPYPVQVQRLMTAMIADHRRMRTHEIVLPAAALVLEPLDTIAWTSASNSYTAKLFEVSSVARDLSSGNVRVGLREIDAGDFDPPSGLVRPSPPDMRPIIPAVQGVPGWAVAPYTIVDSDSNARRPAVKATWTAGGADDARGLRIVYRLDGEGGGGTAWPLVDPRDGAAILELLPDTAYELRARYVADRPLAWSSWKKVTTPAVLLDLVDLGGDLGDFFDESPGVPGTPSLSSQAETLPGGAQSATVTATWTAGTNAASYEVEITPSGGSARVVKVAELRAAWSSLPGQGWAVRVRSVTRAGKRSAWSSSTSHTATSDSTPPATPTGLAAAAGLGSVWLSWNSNSEPDLDRYEIYVASSATPAPTSGSAASQVARGTAAVVQGLPASATRHFWIRAVDTSGNKSGWSSRVQATTPVGAAVDPASLVGVIDATMLAASLKGVEVVSTLPGAPHVEGRTVYLTTDDKLYRNTGSGWTKAVAAADVTGQLGNSQISDLAAAKVTGQIAGTQIADDAVTASKVAAGAVITAKIAAGAVTADQIAANAVTSAKIAAGEVKTANLAAGAVTADQIAANAVVAAKIAAGAVSTEQLAARSVLATNLALLDFTNLILNPDLQTSDGWTLSADVDIATPAASMEVARALRITNTSVNRYAIWRVEAGQIVSGETYLFTMLARASGTAPRQFRPVIRITWLDAASAAIGANVFLPFDPIADTVPHPLSATAVAPAGAVAADVAYGRQAQTPGDAGVAWIARPAAYRMNGAQLTVDGSLGARHLTVDEAVITVAAQIADAIIGNAHISELTSEILRVLSLLQIEEGGALSAGKASPDDSTDGLFFGRYYKDEADDGFALAASRLNGADIPQQVLLTRDEFTITNASFRVSATAVDAVQRKTADMAATALPGKTMIRIASAIGGGKGGAGGSGGSSAAGSNGGNTIVKLYDGGTLKLTITALGATDTYGKAGEAQKGIDPGNRGGGGPGHSWVDNEDRTHRGLGGKAGQVVSRDWIDISSWTTPKIQITIGAGGSGGGSGPEKGGDGVGGAVAYQTMAGAVADADVLSLAPTATGTITKTTAAGQFPDLGPGYWEVWVAGSDLQLSGVVPSVGVSMDLTNLRAATIMASQRVSYAAAGAARTISYTFRAMGNRG